MSIEERVAILEREMADLKNGMAQAHLKPNWIDRVKGSFKDDPDFGEILRLGKEIRKAATASDADGDA